MENIEKQTAESIKSHYSIIKFVISRQMDNEADPKARKKLKWALVRIRAKERAELISPYVNFVFFLSFAVVALTLTIIKFYEIFSDLNTAGKFNDAKTIIYEIILTTWGKLFIALTLITAARLLFWFKKNKQFFYGIVETSFGAANCYVVADNLSQQSDKFIYLTIAGMSTVYLMVRGFSNISDGYNEYKKRMLTREKLDEFVRDLSKHVRTREMLEALGRVGL